MSDELNFSWDMFAAAASGHDESGDTASAASIAIFKFVDGAYSQQRFVSFENAELNVYFNGGCAVFTADFSRDFMRESSIVAKVCADYLTSMREDPDTLLMLTVAPFAFEGKLYGVFNGLTYVELVKRVDTTHLILVFDHNVSQAVGTDEIDYRAIDRNAYAEVKKMSDDLDDEILALEEEEKALNEQNFYEEVLNTNMDNIMDTAISEQQEQLSSNKNFRFSSDDDEK